MFIYLLLGTLVILLIMSRDLKEIALKKYKLEEKAEDELIRDFEDI